MRCFSFILVSISFALFASPLFACPTCKGTLHDNGVATGYAISILFMMGMPFLIMAFWALMIYRMRKQMQIAHLAEARQTT